MKMTKQDINALIRGRSNKTIRTGKQVGKGMNSWLRSKGQETTAEQKVAQVMAKYPDMTIDHAREFVAKYLDHGGSHA